MLLLSHVRQLCLEYRECFCSTLVCSFVEHMPCDPYLHSPLFHARVLTFFFLGGGVLGSEGDLDLCIFMHGHPTYRRKEKATAYFSKCRRLNRGSYQRSQSRIVRRHVSGTVDGDVVCAANHVLRAHVKASRVPTNFLDTRPSLMGCRCDCRPTVSMHIGCA